MPYSITRADAERDLKALRYLLEVGMVRHSSVVEVLTELADSIEEQVSPPDLTSQQIAIKEAQHKGWMLGYTEAWNNATNGDLPPHPPLDDAGNPWVEEQVKPVVEEPKEFGSIVRAGQDEYSNRVLWCRTRKGAWFSEEGAAVGSYSFLDKPEVLRVGIDGGYDHTLQQVRDLLFRSPSGSLTNEEIAAAYKALRKGLSGILSDSPQTDDGATVPDAYDRESWRNGYNLGARNTRERIYNRQTALKSRLITAPEKNAIDKGLALIEADVEDTVTGRGCPS